MQQYSLLRFWCSLGDPFCTEDDVRTLSAFLPRVTNECVEAAIRGLRNARSETSARSEWDRRFLAQFS